MKKSNLKVTDAEVMCHLKQLQVRIEQVSNKCKEHSELSLRQQCAEMGLKTSNLSKYKLKYKNADEEETPKKMQVDKLIRICKYYNVSADYLLGFSSDDKSQCSFVADDKTIKQLCDFTGLSRQAIDFLHEKSTDQLYTFALSFLFSDDEILNTIIKYLSTSLYDDLAKDTRYNLLPGANRSVNTEGRQLYSEIMENLQLSRRMFHDKISISPITRNKYISEIAYKSIDEEKVFSELYPHITFDPSLTPNEAKELNEMQGKNVIQNGNNHSEFLSFLDTVTKGIEDDEYTQERKLQANNFYKELWSHKKSKYFLKKRTKPTNKTEQK